jgi:hypothetical protein
MVDASVLTTPKVSIARSVRISTTIYHGNLRLANRRTPVDLAIVIIIPLPAISTKQSTRDREECPVEFVMIASTIREARIVNNANHFIITT